MATQESKSARVIAIAALSRFNPKRDYASQILSQLLPQTSQRQKATDLVFGTVRNSKAIDIVVAKLADCSVERIPAKVLNIIRIGVYELVYSPATAEYAIVNEAVENAKAVAGVKKAGFVNAVLRQVTRHIKNRQVPLSLAVGKKAKAVLPQTPSTGCEFDIDILPEPQQSPADYFSNAFSLPKWLVSDWLSVFGTEKTRQTCFASNRRPSVYIRPNSLKTTAQGLAEMLRQANVELDILPDESMLRVKTAEVVTELAGFAEGLFTIQDRTASRPVFALVPKADETILDLCAAPGTKTTQLAELTGDKARIIATDIDSIRLERVRENADRLGITSIRTTAYRNVEEIAAGIGLFDAVLLDVPCSNTGVLAKRPEVRFRITPKTTAELAKVQAELLKTAAKLIKPQGRICYSTCSIQLSENHQLIADFTGQNPEFECKYEELMLPSAKDFDCDGGYVAVVGRSK
jgi:16S rRNA (cytosine967-C5)-methyltransferase